MYKSLSNSDSKSMNKINLCIYVEERKLKKTGKFLWTFIYTYIKEAESVNEEKFHFNTDVISNIGMIVEKNNTVSRLCYVYRLILVFYAYLFKADIITPNLKSFLLWSTTFGRSVIILQFLPAVYSVNHELSSKCNSVLLWISYDNSF